MWYRYLVAFAIGVIVTELTFLAGCWSNHLPHNLGIFFGIALFFCGGIAGIQAASWMNEIDRLTSEGEELTKDNERLRKQSGQRPIIVK